MPCSVIYLIIPSMSLELVYGNISSNKSPYICCHHIRLKETSIKVIPLLKTYRDKAYIYGFPCVLGGRIVAEN